MDGLEALPLIRKACPKTRVVVLSGFEADAMAKRALDAGADGYLQKGLPVSDILDYVRLLTGLDANGHAPAERDLSQPNSRDGRRVSRPIFWAAT